MRIEVTEKDILNGQRCWAYSCPVALAIQRASGFMNVFVCPSFIAIDETGQDVELPQIATIFINSFDKSKPVEPFAFDLPIAAK